jgi:ABC-type Na+ transport system ATPase subunit NatA
MLKRLTLGASITALALGVAAPTAFAADKPLYGVLIKTLSNPFWGAMEKGVDQRARQGRQGTDGISVILISHRLTDVFSVCDRIVVLRQGQVIADDATRDTSINAVVAHLVDAHSEPTLEE